ncbi:MAG TPA: TolC family protein [Gemmatimonadaceae bacterium]|nr:TolC family protein [Gemmatimonadaceae bacterium]
MHTILRIALVVAPAVVAAQGADNARPISVDEAVRLALRNSPTTIAARNQLRTGTSSVRQTFSSFFPTPSLQMNASQRVGTQLVQGVPLPLTGNPWTYGRSVSFGQVTLFDGGLKYYNYRAATQNLHASEANEISQRYNVALSVKTAYYNVLTAREQEVAAQRQLEQAQQQLGVATAKMNAGAATLADSLSGAIAVGNARLAILNAQNSLSNANAALTRLVGADVAVTASPADTGGVERIEVDETTLFQMVLDGPQVRQSQASLAATRASHRAQLTPYLPTLTVSGSYGNNPQSSPTFNWGGGPSSTSASMTFNLNYPLWNGYQRESQLVAARVNMENAEANVRDQRLLAKQNLTTQLNSFRTAMQQIELQQLQIRASEENLRVVTRQYSLGTKQLLDLLTAQTSLDNARNGLITARQSARIAKANIEALIGRDLK